MRSVGVAAWLTQPLPTGDGATSVGPPICESLVPIATTHLQQPATGCFAFGAFQRIRHLIGGPPRGSLQRRAIGWFALFSHDPLTTQADAGETV
jgi:hypothetical protein